MPHDDAVPPPPPLPTRATLRSIGADPQAERWSERPAPPAVPDDEDPGREPFILVARYRKARKISASLLAMGGDSARVAELGRTDLGRQLAADRAGTNVPSPTCWALVVEMVREVRP